MFNEVYIHHVINTRIASRIMIIKRAGYRKVCVSGVDKQKMEECMEYAKNKHDIDMDELRGFQVAYLEKFVEHVKTKYIDFLENPNKMDGISSLSPVFCDDIMKGICMWYIPVTNGDNMATGDFMSRNTRIGWLMTRYRIIRLIESMTTEQKTIIDRFVEAIIVRDGTILERKTDDIYQCDAETYENAASNVGMLSITWRTDMIPFIEVLECMISLYDDDTLDYIPGTAYTVVNTFETLVDSYEVPCWIDASGECAISTDGMVRGLYYLKDVFIELFKLQYGKYGDGISYDMIPITSNGNPYRYQPILDCNLAMVFDNLKKYGVLIDGYEIVVHETPAPIEYDDPSNPCVIHRNTDDLVSLFG